MHGPMLVGRSHTASESATDTSGHLPRRCTYSRGTPFGYAFTSFDSDVEEEVAPFLRAALIFMNSRISQYA